jgi:LAS superfamily LD-carboxypeptidase LdcB
MVARFSEMMALASRQGTALLRTGAYKAVNEHREKRRNVVLEQKTHFG